MPPRRRPASKIASSKTILNLSHTEARRIFLKSENYCNFDLPDYIKFDEMLKNIDRVLSKKTLSQLMRKDLGGKFSLRTLNDLNHIILNNKDGKFAWRPMTLIHPALYVSLIRKITDKDCWKKIISRFSKFSSNPKIECISYPIYPMNGKRNKAEQILHWWKKMEQRSIVLAMDFEYLFQTDITDCYGAIYTHSIAWALHDKEIARERRNDQSLIGNFIDKQIQDFSYGQTNGIPQGSTLMDFIAEIVLGCADLSLSEKITEEGISDYHILRYRDDYKIFVNNSRDGEKIIKFLTETMIDLSLKLNSSKTTFSSNVIKDSIKHDKLYFITIKNMTLTFKNIY